MVEHEDYTVPPESREWLPLMLARWLRDTDPETWQGVGLGELRETCAVWLALRRRARDEGRAL